MIVLEALHIENFKTLRQVELRFPQVGSILVEGLNEAGKSSLFESVYFALYGAPLVTAGAAGRLEDVIRYGADICTVALSLDADGTKLEVQRVARRGKVSQATLVVTRPGDEPEIVQGAQKVSVRIVEELGRLDGDALLNSCFVEQKKLSKLEDLNAAQRRASLLNLLNLEKLEELETEFRPTRADETDLAHAKSRRELAEIRYHVPVLEERKAGVERLLQAIAVRRAFDTLANQRGIVAEAILNLQSLNAKRQAVQGRLDEFARLGRAAHHAENIAHEKEAIATLARRQLEIRSDLDELERKEVEDVPSAEERHRRLTALTAGLAEWEGRKARVAEIGLELDSLSQIVAERSRLRDEGERVETDLAERRAQLTEGRARLARLNEEEANDLPRLDADRRALEGLVADLEALARERARIEESARELASLRSRRADAARLERQISDVEAELRKSEPELTQARLRLQRAREAERLVLVRDVLAEWTRIRRSVDALERQGKDLGREEAETETARLEVARLSSRFAEHSAVARRWWMLAGAAAVACLGSGLLGLLPLAFLFLASAIVLLVLAQRERGAGSRLRPSLTEAAAAHANREDRLKLLSLERDAAARLGGDRTMLLRAEERLGELKEGRPVSVEAAEARQQEISHLLAGRDRAAITQELASAGEDLEALQAARRQREASVVVLSRQLSELDPAGLDQKISARQQAVEAQQQVIKDLDAQLSPRLAERGLPADVGQVREALAGRRHDIGALQNRLAERRPLRDQLAEAQRQIEERERRLGQIGSELRRHDDAELARRGEALAIEHSSTETDMARRQEALQPEAEQFGLGLDSAEVRVAATRAKADLDSLRRDVARRPGLADELEKCRRAEGERLSKVGEEETNLGAIELEGLAAPLGGGMVAYQTFQGKAIARQLALGEPKLREELATLNTARGRESNRVEEAQRRIDQISVRLRGDLESLGAAADVDLDLPAVEVSLPVVVEATTADERGLQEQRQELVGQIGAKRHQQTELERRLQLVGIELDLQECEAEEARLARGLEVKRRAVRIVSEARKRMVAKVLPNTERNMRLLLPLLTIDRYHDAHITEDYRIEVWDETAGRYVAKSIFSGGTKDQFSLALRLAFALATLPQELGTTPGFIFLDEPLSSFDSQRTQALVDLVTRGQIAANFRQIFVISHSRSFDAASFPYRFRLEMGQVAESNLPSFGLAANSV